VLLVQNIDTNRMLYDIEKLIKLYILFLIIDALVRYGYLYFAFRSGTATIKSFYNFKFSPITAGDTNYLALRILYPMCLLIFVEAYFHKNKWRIYIYTFYGFIILTISRSAIVAGTLLLMIRHFSSLLRYKRYCLLSMELIFGIAGLVIVFMSLFLKDGSFATKLEILKSLNKIYDAQLSNVIFGFGIDEGRHIYSYRDESFGHTHLSLIIGQFGILGLLLYIGFFIGLYIKTKGGTFYLTCAFIISGFSLIDLGPNLFWVFGLLDVLSRRRTKHEITVYS
jgi:hypothetical protein